MSLNSIAFAKSPFRAAWQAPVAFSVLCFCSAHSMAQSNVSAAAGNALQECMALHEKAQYASDSFRYLIQGDDILRINLITITNPPQCSKRKVGALSDTELSVWKIEGSELVQYPQYAKGSRYVIATERAAKPAVTAQPGMPKTLPGTAWNLEFPDIKGRGKTGMIYLFCKTDRWQVVPSRGGIGPQGTYRVEGSKLITRGEDGKVEQYSLQWGPSWVDLVGGSSPMRLHYETAARC